jgi:hypothetical protein
MEKTVVDILYEDFSNIDKYLLAQEELSFKIRTDDIFRKSLLLSSASFFETHICEIIIKYVDRHSKSNLIINAFLKNKAISRQYHTFFNWETSNANNFLGLLGEDFKKFMQEEIKKDERLELSIRDFMEIGKERNRLVHQNYGLYTIEKTSDEIFKLYKSALYFLEIFQSRINSFKKSN